MAQGGDFCSGDTLQPTCSSNEVLVFTNAAYGRMHFNKECRITSDHGYIGCQGDVLGVLDTSCSGRSSCSVRVPNDDLVRPASLECLQDFVMFLEASYTCEKGSRMKNSTYLCSTLMILYRLISFQSSRSLPDPALAVTQWCP